MLKINYSENELIGKSRNDQLFFAFILKEQWNPISCSLEMSNWKDINIAWNESGTQADVLCLSWWVVTHLGITVCTEHLIISSIENVYSDIL